MRALVLAALIGASLSVTGSALACPLTNPNCLVDEVDKTVQDTVDDVDETTDRVVEEANETVEDVQETVEEVEKTVGETVAPPPGPTDPPPPPTEPEDPGPRDPSPNDRERDPNVKGREVERDGVRDGRSDAAVGPAPIDPPSNLLLPSALRIVAADDPSGPEESLGESAVEAAKDFAFPLVMTVLVGIYLVVQHRVDRRDPKFALAPVEHELLSFE